MSTARIAFGASVCLLLCGCSMSEIPVIGSLPGTDTAPASHAGLVVGDEAQAVQAGAAILNNGGSAADAATATYFALAVTYPQAAGLGGGGACIVHDPQTRSDVEIDFVPHAPSGGGAFAIPGNVRGFEALQQRFGTIAWARDVVAGERLASTGFDISQALETQLVASQNAVRLDATLAAEFLDESGKVEEAQTNVDEPDLAATLAAIRTGGANVFYRDEIARRIAAYSAQQGGSLTPDELANYQAIVGAPQEFARDGTTIVLPTARSGAAILALAFFHEMNGNDAARDAVKNALLAVGNVADDTGATGFATRDAQGQAVACAVTMNGAFGSGRTVAGTGVTLARAPAATSSAANVLLTPGIALDGNGDAIVTGAATGSVERMTAFVHALTGTASKPAAPATPPADDTGSFNVIRCRGDEVCIASPGSTGLGLSTGVQ